ncbi:MAG: HAD family hydrolase [Armatimonadota bacterium]
MRALIFDFDGTLVDTESPEYDAWEAVYAEHGESIPLESWLGTIGLPSGVAPWHPLEHLAARVEGIDREALAVRQRADFHARANAQPLLPGVEAWMDDAEAAGIAIGVASSATRDWVHGHLQSRGVRERFRTVRTREDVAHAKPHPDLYLLACADLGVAPGDALAIEDSAHGVAAARAAGLACIAVPNRLTRHHDLSAADRVVESLSALRLSGWRASGGPGR